MNISAQDKEMLIALINASAFKGEHAEQIAHLKHELSNQVENKWQHACRNALPPAEYERIKSIAES